jgi:hypothetical protein
MAPEPERVTGPLYPTYRCFDDAIAFCEARARAGHPSVHTTLRLVHGIVLTPDDQLPGIVPDAPPPGAPSAHAWVEDEGLVWDAGQLFDGRRVVFAVDQAEYYAHYRVQQVTRYTMAEVLAENRASGHYGPWRPEYRALCRGGHQ